MKEDDLKERSFVFDVYVLTTRNINPFLLKQKIFDAKNREMIHMFWEDCNESSFYRHICKPDNFMYLNVKNVIYPRLADIVWNYIEEDEQNFNKIKKWLVDNIKIFQFVYSNVYPEVYRLVEKRGIELRNNFHLKFKDWKDRKKYWQKSIEGYFSKSEGSPPPPAGMTQKKLVTDEDFTAEKNWPRSKNRERWKRENKKVEKKGEKLRQKTKNLNE